MFVGRRGCTRENGGKWVEIRVVQGKSGQSQPQMDTDKHRFGKGRARCPYRAGLRLAGTARPTFAVNWATKPVSCRSCNDRYRHIRTRIVTSSYFLPVAGLWRNGADCGGSWRVKFFIAHIWSIRNPLIFHLGARFCGFISLRKLLIFRRLRKNRGNFLPRMNTDGHGFGTKLLITLCNG